MSGITGCYSGFVVHYQSNNTIAVQSLILGVVFIFAICLLLSINNIFIKQCTCSLL